MATRKRAAPKRKSRAKNKPLPGWIWLLAGLVIGLSATFLPKLNEQYINNIATSQPKQTTAPVELEPERSFDFYTLLPELEVVVDKNQKPLPDNKIKAKGAESYVLQIGSFKQSAEADTLKARLALLGVETNIEIVTVNKTSWHRVRIGPSKDINHLESIQARLKNEKLDSILLKVRS